MSIQTKIPTTMNLKNLNVPAGDVLLLFAKPDSGRKPRRSLWIYNTHATDAVNIRKAKQTTGDKITLKADSDIHFEPLKFGTNDKAEGEEEDVVYCEWTEEVWIHNPGANAIDIEAIEVY